MLQHQPRTEQGDAGASSVGVSVSTEARPREERGLDAAQRAGESRDAPGRDLQRLAGQSAEVLSLYARITGLVQQHLTELTETAERLRQQLDRETERVVGVRSERAELERELESLRLERDSLRRELEAMIQTGLARRRELATEIEELARARDQEPPPAAPTARRRLLDGDLEPLGRIAGRRQRVRQRHGVVGGVVDRVDRLWRATSLPHDREAGNLGLAWPPLHAVRA